MVGYLQKFLELPNQIVGSFDWVVRLMKKVRLSGGHLSADPPFVMLSDTSSNRGAQVESAVKRDRIKHAWD